MTTGFLLAIALVILSFALKLFIDQQIDMPIFIKRFLELPVDFNFLGLAFIVAYITKDPTNTQNGLLYFVGLIVVSIFTIFLWRRSTHCFILTRTIWTWILGTINVLISFGIMYCTLTLLK